MLPEPFLARMKQMLGEEYEAFLASSQKEQAQSLRVNLLKGSACELAQKVDFLEEKVPWALGGFYYSQSARPGKHPYHEAGAYYIQEASAMAPAFVLDPGPGERVLDLCAAPGGKSTQIAADMKGEGLLVSNEIHPARARSLSENIERMGIRNCLVLSHEPAFLSRRFSEFFDKILVDAPCSGEGMFRKNPEALKEWSPEKVKGCAKRQADILDQAAFMLREGGRMVYSTCTFSPEENENTIDDFLRRHSEFEREAFRLPQTFGERGSPDPKEELRAAGELRLWPHKVRGEGHFLACLHKKSRARESGIFVGEEMGGRLAERISSESEKGIPKREYRCFEEFGRQYLRTSFEGVYVKFADQLYLLPQKAPALKGLKVLRPGLHLGTIRKERFEPAHSLALCLRPQEAVYRYELSFEEAAKYLRGETFPARGEKGWYLLTVGGYSLGWGKLSGEIMKNHYPKGLRK